MPPTPPPPTTTLLLPMPPPDMGHCSDRLSRDEKKPCCDILGIKGGREEVGEFAKSET